MPNLTHAEITALERRIAEGVMEWEHIRNGLYQTDDGERVWVPDDWSPWNDERAALEVLKRLAKPKDAPFGITFWRGQNLWIAWIGAISLDQRYVDAMAPGDHFGPAVCLLAKQVMENSK